MHKIFLRAFILLGFTIQACASLAAAASTIKSETTVTKQVVGQAYAPRGQEHQLDRTDNLRLAQNYNKSLRKQENRTPKKTAEGSCARCAENFPICVYNSTLYSNKKTEALRKRHAVSNCIIREDKCLKKCK